MRSYYAIINEERPPSEKSHNWKQSLREAQDKLLAPFKKK